MFQQFNATCNPLFQHHQNHLDHYNIQTNVYASKRKTAERSKTLKNLRVQQQCYENACNILTAVCQKKKNIYKVQKKKYECAPVKEKQFKQKLGSLNAKVLALQMKKQLEEVEKPAGPHATRRRMQHPANSCVNE